MQITIFSKLYAATLRWSQHRRAPWFLGGVSFAESSFFPIPPDVMLLPMCISNRQHAWWYALLTTLTSVAGAVVGYVLGAFAAEWVQSTAAVIGWEDKFTEVEVLYATCGLWIVFAAGFTPIPYKIFTITSGLFGLNLLLFLLISLVARGARYGLVAAAGYYGGPLIERYFMRYLDRIGLAAVALLLVCWLLYRML